MRKGPRDAALLLYPVRESNASLILRRDSFYPSELTRLISECKYRKKREIIKRGAHFRAFKRNAHHQTRDSGRSINK